MHAAPTETHSIVMGQHTWFVAQLPCVPGPVQKCPGLTGVKQCSASGQQYDRRSEHVVVHGPLSFTHSFVRGQQSSSAAHTVGSTAQLVFVGAAHFPPGQQYSAAPHAR